MANEDIEYIILDQQKDVNNAIANEGTDSFFNRYRESVKKGMGIKIKSNGHTISVISNIDEFNEWERRHRELLP